MTDAISPLATATTTTRTAASAGREVTSDYQTFLRMLTVQMQNQDPLNPIESADYAVQLATFSGVEQQTRTNQLIEQLLSRFDLGGMADLAGAVGREALSAGPVWFDGRTPVTVSAELASGADRGVLVVRDPGGTVVDRLDLAGSGTVRWDGTSVTGAALPPGRYSLSVESLQGETVLSAKPAPAYARVEEVRRTADGIALMLRGGVMLPERDLLALRG